MLLADLDNALDGIGAASWLWANKGSIGITAVIATTVLSLVTRNVPAIGGPFAALFDKVFRPPGMAPVSPTAVAIVSGVAPEPAEAISSYRIVQSYWAANGMAVEQLKSINATAAPFWIAPVKE